MKISQYFVLFFLFNVSVAFTQTRLYVKSDAIGLEDGTSWQNAFTTLTNALGLVNDGDTIWIAKGIYYPTNTDDVSKCFIIDKKLSIFGGFSGIENNLNERNYVANLSILSGNIGDTSSISDNSNQIAKVIFDDRKILIDGIVFRQANSENINGGGIAIETNSAAAGALIIQNCQFNRNLAFSGGAIFVKQSTGFLQNVIINNCSFSDNTAIYQGGAIAYEYTTELDSIKINNCKFSKNIGKEGGGAISFKQIYGGNLEITKCDFLENKTAYSGMAGGAIFFTYNDENFNLRIDGCNFNKNVSGTGGALAFLQYFLNADKIFNLEILNTTFTENKIKDGSGGAIIIANSAGTLNFYMTKCLFLKNTATLSSGGIFIDASSNSTTNLVFDEINMQQNFVDNQPEAAGAFFCLTNDEFGPTKLIVRVKNSIFANNGGVCAILTRKSSGDVEFTNCTFYRNSTYPFVKFWKPDFNYVNYYNIMKFYNCIIWENTEIKNVFYNNNFTNYRVNDYYVYNSIINTPTCEYNGVSVCQKDVLLQENPKFRNPLMGDFRLAVCSPAIDFGDNLHADSIGLSEDYFGNPRFVNNKIDLGAIESPDTALAIQSNFTDSIEILANNGFINIDSVFGGWSPYWIDWTTGQQSFNLNNLIVGQYTATITDSIGCKGTFIFNIDEYLGLSDLKPFAKKIKISPNPISDAAIINFENENNDFIDLKLININGKMIWQKENIQFPFYFKKGNIPAGVYFLIYQNDQNIGVSKIVLE